ncbi:hypothetical protein GE21DRAFT_1327487 [Neurospora crassa]|nr:hypothetical protein GE21DRAFT_1327487 [Neurospora crassa]
MEEKRCIVTPAAVGSLSEKWYKCRLQYHTLIRTKLGCCVVLCSVFCVPALAPKSTNQHQNPIVTVLSLLLVFIQAGFTLELCEAAVCFLDDVDRATTCPSFRYSIFPLETVMCPSRQIAFSTSFDRDVKTGSKTCLRRASVLHLSAVSHRAGAIKVHPSHPQTREIGRVQMVIVKNWSVLGLYDWEEEKEKRAGEIPFDRRIPLEETIRLRCGKQECPTKRNGYGSVRAKSDNHFLFWQDAVTPSGRASVATVPQGQEEHTTSRRVFNATKAQRLSRAPIYRLRRLFDAAVNGASNGDQHRNRRHQSPLIVISMSDLTSLETMKCEYNACDGPLATPSCFINCNHGVLIL